MASNYFVKLITEYADKIEIADANESEPQILIVFLNLSKSLIRTKLIIDLLEGVKLNIDEKSLKALVKTGFFLRRKSGR